MDCYRQRLNNKGVIVRFVTEVKEGNVSFCRELMKYEEVLHNESVVYVYYPSLDTRQSCSSEVDWQTHTTLAPVITYLLIGWSYGNVIISIFER